MIAVQYVPAVGAPIHPIGERELVPVPTPATTQVHPEVHALQQEELERLVQLVTQLSAENRELLALRFTARLTYQEIATMLGKREDTVKKHMRRLLRKLKVQYDAP